jgi:hypothetical protein
MNRTRTLSPRDALVLSGIFAHGRPGALRGALMRGTDRPVNRAERRLLARMVRRGMVPT